MKPYCHCTVEYIPSPHLMQLYTGFFALEEKGEIKLHMKPLRGRSIFKPLINVVVNGKTRVVYDMLDGLNWIPGGLAENYAHFQKNFPVDFYFKRSYQPELRNLASDGCLVYPLGLNYLVYPQKNLWQLAPGWWAKIKYLMRRSPLARKMLHLDYQPVYTSSYECAPSVPKEKSILFVTRLWNPEEARTGLSRSDREQANEVRIDAIRACKKEFGPLMHGGVIDGDFSRRYCPDLIVPPVKTSKMEYIKTIRQHAVCVATTGLHQSIGWKLGEFVAASRAIVSEPLRYELPGNFSAGSNYFSFSSSKELVNQIGNLLDDEQLLLQTMQQNHEYYLQHVRPAAMVRNTLMTVLQHKVEDRSREATNAVSY